MDPEPGLAARVALLESHVAALTAAVAALQAERARPVPTSESPTAPPPHATLSPSLDIQARHARPQSPLAPPLVTFSGFGDDADRLATLRDVVLKLGGRVKANPQEFDAAITHVVALPGARTLKLLAAGLTGRWIMRPEWLTASAAESGFVDEAGYGARFPVEDNPFRGRRLYLADAFVASISKTKLANFTKLAFKLGRAVRVDSEAAADIVVVPPLPAGADPHQRPVHHRTWHELIHAIPSCPPDDGTESGHVDKPSRLPPATSPMVVPRARVAPSVIPRKRSPSDAVQREVKRHKAKA
ncbi:uncharacterized protein AMSG_02452 [Thecamonas trahens ATCC 50062]|uniref:BRCT domain-containing protein n=1 Tax=Thecamonas trahens ATCC 50062 TaxID=461836 RepID=A0A0L0D525_THETB|nr:hypothetical protein AMSG_02452 [Thecamonas trahens ATCC 50062]KNC47434.1 hypothetical protein AMSG_02452 [Thecamonas trahens ATCC 50062]|eukprot:XP_013759371.1 hypothetical protein AMSG_02452 [Thecamonas trahens ATCC 50062]